MTAELLRHHMTSKGKVYFTPEEEDARNLEEQEWEAGATARAEQTVREKRDILLAETDWVVTKALEADETVALEWATYRQALRDITSHENFPDLAEDDWPTKP